MLANDLDFHLPPDLIAQTPAERREASRLLHYQRIDRAVVHRCFSDLPELLRPGDLLVFNNARVTPARFTLRKPTGGRVEGLFVREVERRLWEVMLKNLGPVRPGLVLSFSNDEQATARVVEQGEEGIYRMQVATDEPALQLLARVGRMPLPPYIRRDRERDERDHLDRERYQTVYAAAPGSVAAPTAGLHFTQSLMGALEGKGVQRTFITLDVGLGTFKPVTADALEQHVMHVESYTIDAAAAEALNRAKAHRQRIIAVGTTSARVLESHPPGEQFRARFGQTGIFIYPPYQWRHVDALITNFHLPRSTLIALVAAFVGLDEQRRLYQTAIEQRYRFFSYGDAMFLE
jgi:S-adenosylmethionine:tRNA ribosyltransferase-isomerase